MAALKEDSFDTDAFSTTAFSLDEPDNDTIEGMEADEWWRRRRTLQVAQWQRNKNGRR